MLNQVYRVVGLRFLVKSLLRELPRYIFISTLFKFVEEYFAYLEAPELCIQELTTR